MAGKASSGTGRAKEDGRRAKEAGEGETKVPMIIGLIGTLLNLVLDPIFIFVLEYGVKGAALATVISQAVMVVSYLFIIFVRKSTYITFNIRDFKIRVCGK